MKKIDLNLKLMSLDLFNLYNLKLLVWGFKNFSYFLIIIRVLHP